jgi:hypothetical protein
MPSTLYKLIERGSPEPEMGPRSVGSVHFGLGACHKGILAGSDLSKRVLQFRRNRIRSKPGRNRFRIGGSPFESDRLQEIDLKCLQGKDRIVKTWM